MTLSCYDMFCVNFAKALCTEVYDMQISEAAGGAPAPGAEPCRFPKLEECAHFHYEKVQLPQVSVTLQTNMDQSLHSQHTNEDTDIEWFMVQVTSGDACWIVQRNFENFKMVDDQLHQCIFDRKISQLQDLSTQSPNDEDLENKLILYLERFSQIADNSVNCGPVLNWLQMDNKGHRLLVPSEESRSINTPAVAAAYSVRRYVSQARDELNLEVGDMISVIDMASPGESMWWRGKRGFQVGFFPQHCVHIIGDKVPRNMPLPPPVVGSLALTPIKPVLRKHGKLITFFRSFILNRPSRRRLKQSGILKERVFGCDLGEHLLNSGNDIPNVLKCCAEFIETNGIVDGIYRLSGVTSNISKLRNAFDEDRIPNLYTEDILQDIHSVASLLKMYFRELPNPLCTYQLYQSFVNAVQGCSTAIRNSETDHERLLKMREAVQKLPPPHYRTLEYLMRHLARVAKHGPSTGMTTRNVAIVWAPNLLRCEALEVGGVAALQGVGVQAVVTEFLICYADLIFCDHLPNLDHPLVTSENILMKKCRPNSLAISTPTKLITLEEARSKHLPNKAEECSYIEVGGGPKNLPKKYHTILELPSGARKRAHTKRSPLGWRLFFTKSRNTSQNLPKNRNASTPITINEKSITESDLTDMKRKLRTVKSAESLTSGHSEPASTEDILGPLHSLIKPPGHNRSVSHDSYFDVLQNSHNNSEGSLLDLSEIQLNFELEESEMRIFSEDESLVSSPRIHKETQRRILTRARPEEYSSAANSGNPSPKKQPRVIMSPESHSRKRTRLEDQLSDIQYIDCSTPDCIVSTTAVIHSFSESPVVQKNKQLFESYQPKNKSPRNSDNLDKRQSLNLESSVKSTIPKSLTEIDLNQKCLRPTSLVASSTPGSPGYKQLGESSANTTPEASSKYDSSPTEGNYHRIIKNEAKSPLKSSSPNTPNYENLLTTINITYKSPPQSLATSPVKSPATNIYENVIMNPEKVSIPTSAASLPIQEASQPNLTANNEFFESQAGKRPKSLSALEDLTSSKESTIKANLSSSAICNTSEQLSIGSFSDQKTLSSNQSSGSNIQYTASISSAPYHFIDNSEQLSPTDLSLSEVVESSTENLSTSHTTLSSPISPSKNSLSPNVSPTQVYDCSSQEALTPISPTETKNTSEGLSTDNLDNLHTEAGCWQSDQPPSVNHGDISPLDVKADSLPSPSRSINSDKRKSDETECLDDSAIYQQVKYFRRSIHEVNALLDLENGLATSEEDNDCSENVYEDIVVENGDVRVKDDIAVDPTFENEVSEEIDTGIEKEQDEENFDSLEPQISHVYENIEGENLRNGMIYENVQIAEEKTESPVQNNEASSEAEVQSSPQIECEIVCNKEEESVAIDKHKDVLVSSEKPVLPLDLEKIDSSETENSTNKNNSPKLKKFYEKDSLPPCLRARNLKHQLKTRSLDEEEFEKEFGVNLNRNRTTFDENLSHKTNSLPKTLNQPKTLPDDGGRMSSIHLAHSTENIRSNLTEEEEQKKRERIERYKEERRRILQDKYRSESFKEDKEVLLTRLRIFKQKDETIELPKSTDLERPPRCRRRSSRSEDGDNQESTSKLEEPTNTKAITGFAATKDEPNVTEILKKDIKPMKDSLKSRAAMFEQNSQKLQPPTTLIINKNRSSFRDLTKQTESYAKNFQDTREKIYSRIDKKESIDDLKDLDFIRNKRDTDFLREEKRRHTFDTRERESDAERLRRISLESRSPRKEKASPTYCIKDMKAIFESKSKQ